MKKFLQSINPYNKIWKLFLANLVISVVIMAMFWGRWYNSFTTFLISLVWSYTICITQWVGHVYINNKLAKKFSWQHHTSKRMIWGALSIVVYGSLAFVLVQLLMNWIINGHSPVVYWKYAIKSSIYAVVTSFIISVVYTALGFFKAWKNSWMEAEKYKAEMLAYKYETLQNQINPHFFFNSLNVLTDLVYEDQQKAVDFIKKLSSLFRYVLDSREKELVSIADELKFIKSYTYLLQTRFENKLEIVFDIEPNNNEFIVPMALQILIENCVKHNEISTQRPLKIKISRKGNNIVVSNNLQPKNAGSESVKLGMENIKQQYRYFTDNEIVIVKADGQYSVQIPIIEIETA